MTYIIIWAFIAYGMTTILVYGSIFDGLRALLSSKSKFFAELIKCPLCTSTWVGFFMSFTMGGLTANYYDINTLYGVFLDGMLTAGIVWAINSVIEFFEESRIK